MIAREDTHCTPPCFKFHISTEAMWRVSMGYLSVFIIAKFNISPTLNSSVQTKQLSRRLRYSIRRPKLFSGAILQRYIYIHAQLYNSTVRECAGQKSARMSEGWVSSPRHMNERILVFAFPVCGLSTQSCRTVDCNSVISRSAALACAEFTSTLSYWTSSFTSLQQVFKPCNLNWLCALPIFIPSDHAGFLCESHWWPSDLSRLHSDCHDLEVLSSNPARDELGVRTTSVLSRT